eukprot:7389379-Prymnesium_polylepis.2
MEPVEDSARPLRRAIKQDYPADRFVVAINDDGYYRRVDSGDGLVRYEVTDIGQEMEQMIYSTVNDLLKRNGGDDGGITKRVREVATDGEGCRKDPAPGGCTVIEFEAAGLPLVQLIARKKGLDSFMKTGNLENALWNVLPPDVEFTVFLDCDMTPKKDLLQLIISPFFKCDGDRWKPDWVTGFVTSPQTFSNTESVWGADDPMNQANRFFFRTLPQALDADGLCQFCGTNAAFFVPALKTSNGFVYGCMTEDTVTGAQLHRFGWASTFIGLPGHALASGLARTNVAETFDQRKRWCIGNVQQFLMETNPACLLSPDFVNAPYRTEFRNLVKMYSARDQTADALTRLAAEDTGSLERWRRRTSRLRWVKHQLAYLPTKFAAAFHVQPFYYFAISLVLVLTGEGPIWADLSPVRSVSDFLSSFWSVVAYLVLGGLSNFFINTYSLDDPENASSNIWRTQQEFFGYAWVRLIGIFQGLFSAITGRQPRWNAFGMKGRSTLLYGLPNAVMFCSMMASMVLVTVEYACVVSASNKSLFGLCSDHVSSLELAMRLFTGALMLINLWPVTACIFADFLGLRYFLPSNLLFTFLGAMAPSLVILLWSATQSQSE